MGKGQVTGVDGGNGHDGRVGPKPLGVTAHSYSSTAPLGPGHETPAPGHHWARRCWEPGATLARLPYQHQCLCSTDMLLTRQGPGWQEDEGHKVHDKETLSGEWIGDHGFPPGEVTEATNPSHIPKHLRGTSGAIF